MTDEKKERYVLTDEEQAWVEETHRIIDRARKSPGDPIFATRRWREKTEAPIGFGKEYYERKRREEEARRRASGVSDRDDTDERS